VLGSNICNHAAHKNQSDRLLKSQISLTIWGRPVKGIMAGAHIQKKSEDNEGDVSAIDVPINNPANNPAGKPGCANCHLSKQPTQTVYRLDTGFLSDVHLADSQFEPVINCFISWPISQLSCVSMCVLHLCHSDILVQHGYH
jgi:hypothetical protein